MTLYAFIMDMNQVTPLKTNDADQKCRKVKNKIVESHCFIGY